MNKLLRRCEACRVFTLKDACPRCGSKTTSPHPARFSPDDRYARYRTPSRFMAKG